MSTQFDETYNYGRSGAGNEYIFHSLLQADQDLKLTTDDTVVIAWSGFCRFDHYSATDHAWITKGDWHTWVDQHNHNSILHSKLEFILDDTWATKKSLHLIYAAMVYLNAKNIKYVFTSLYDLRLPEHQALVDVIYTDDFILPTGLDLYAVQCYLSDIYYRWGSHPSMTIHKQIAELIATKLGITLENDSDLEYISRLTISEDNVLSKFEFRWPCPIWYRYYTDQHGISATLPYIMYQKYDRQTLATSKQQLMDIFG